MSDNLIPDLDATITSAVQARIEAEVTKALAGDEVIGQLVTVALTKNVEVKNNRTYKADQVPFLRHVLLDTIRLATQEACRRLVDEQMPLIEDEVRKALKREASTIAGQLTSSLSAAAAKAYGIQVTVRLPSSD